MATTIIVAIIAIVTSNLLFDFLEKNMSTSVTLDEFLNNDRDIVRQVVYKIDGDYVGDIKGENVTVILMGSGDFKGDINSKDGTVFLNKGNVIGDIKANKVLCPTNKPSDKSTDATPTCHSCKYYSSYGFAYHYYCKHLKDNFCNPYNTCCGYVERT